MILITTALKCEALPIIALLNMKRLKEETRWELFSDGEEQLLLVTGVGPVSAAASISAVMTKYGFSGKDFLLNVGVCCDLAASEEERGQIYLINKITDGETDRDYYPDMLIESRLKERSLKSVAEPVYSDEGRDIIPLYDMEGAFIFQTAKYYIGPSQMAFLKIVSDNGLNKGKADLAGLAKFTEELVKGHEDDIAFFLKSIREFVCSKEVNREIPKDIELLIADFRASKTMEIRLMQLINYSRCAGIDYRAVIDEMYTMNVLPASCKRDGMKALNRFEEELI